MKRLGAAAAAASDGTRLGWGAELGLGSFRVPFLFLLAFSQCQKPGGQALPSCWASARLCGALGIREPASVERSVSAPLSFSSSSLQRAVTRSGSGALEAGL